MLDRKTVEALDRDLTIDITTTGRKSGVPRITEIWQHRVDGRSYITGTPGTRDWYANLLAEPRFVFHLKGSMRRDLPATAIPITDPAEKRRILLATTTIWTEPGERDVEERVAGSPLIEVRFDDEAGTSD